MNTQHQLVERALGYPYAIPSGSFLLVEGRHRDAHGLSLGEIHTSGRTPLLAYGSNAAPEVLARKLGPSADQDTVLAVRAALADFDVVYSAHISRYGSIPAALQRSPGTEVAVFVVYLGEDQLRLISATEPNYHPAPLRDLSCRLENGDVLTEATAYLSHHGCLLADGREIALSSIEAQGRRFPAMSQPEVLDHVRAMLAPEQTLERFIAESAADPELGRRRTEALKERMAAVRLPRSGARRSGRADRRPRSGPRGGGEG